MPIQHLHKLAVNGITFKRTKKKKHTEPIKCFETLLLLLFKLYTRAACVAFRSLRNAAHSAIQTAILSILISVSLLFGNEHLKK